MPPRWQVTKHQKDKVAPGFWFLGPYRFAGNHLDDAKWVPCQVGPTIYDNDGELVWSGACLTNNRIVFDFGVAEYQGHPVLTGNVKQVNPEEALARSAEFPKPDCGAGFFLNKSYDIEHSILIEEDATFLNQHEFFVLPDGSKDDGSTTLVMTHDTQKLSAADLGLKGDIWTRTDGFRELDTQTGEIIFDWKVHDHVKLNESSYHGSKHPGPPNPPHYSKRRPWDAFHANSVSKTPEGNYLASVRYLDALLLVDGKDGHVIWRLAGTGRLNDFTMEDNLAFSRQHHVRYLEHSKDRSVISILDNAAGKEGREYQPATHDRSRGLTIELDHKAGEEFKARKLKSYERPDGAYADRRGSMQILPNGNVFMAWTDAGYLSEHTEDDEVIMEARWLSDRFGTYRAYKQHWVGMPDTKPDIRVLGHGEGGSAAVYVSWNGATEYRSWSFHSKAGGSLGTANRTGFETVFIIPHGAGPIWAEALDKDEKVLGRSEEAKVEMVNSTTVNAAPQTRPEKAMLGSPSHPILLGLVSLLSLVGVWAIGKIIVQKFWELRDRRATKPKYEEVPLSES
ncbi:hypothetical protein MBLNU230_g2793t1 [Neophaeotheca triangularis]